MVAGRLRFIGYSVAAGLTVENWIATRADRPEGFSTECFQSGGIRADNSLQEKFGLDIWGTSDFIH